MSSIPEITTTLVHEATGQPLAIKKTPTPTTTPPGSALVRVLSTTIRPHNRAGFNGEKILQFPTPYTPGNSAIARVMDVGKDAVSLRPGQLVWVNGFLASRDDPENTKILLGLTDFGQEKAGSLFQAWPGLWTDVASMPLENCIPLDEERLCTRLGYSFGDLEYIERLAVAHGGVRGAELRPGETVVVCPATGHYSGAVAELAAQMGCNVIALTRSSAKLQGLKALYPERVTPLELTDDIGADTAAVRALCPPSIGGADAVIDTSPPAATASSSHLTVGINSLRSGGRAVFLGAMGDVTVNYASFMVRGIMLKGQWMYTRGELLDLLKMIEAGVVKLGSGAGHELVRDGFRLEDWDEAIKVAEEAASWGQQVLFLP